MKNINIVVSVDFFDKTKTEVKTPEETIEYIIDESVSCSDTNQKYNQSEIRIAKLTSITGRMFSLMIDKGLINEEEASMILGEDVSFEK